MLYNIKFITLHQVFHGIRFKVKRLFVVMTSSFFLPSREQATRGRKFEINRESSGLIGKNSRPCEVERPRLRPPGAGPSAICYLSDAFARIFSVKCSRA